MYAQNAPNTITIMGHLEKNMRRAASGYSELVLEANVTPVI